MREWAFRAYQQLLSDENLIFPPVTYHSWLGEILGLLKSIGALPLAFSRPGAASLLRQMGCFRAFSAWQALPLPWQ